MVEGRGSITLFPVKINFKESCMNNKREIEVPMDWRSEREIGINLGRLYIGDVRKGDSNCVMIWTLASTGEIFLRIPESARKHVHFADDTQVGFGDLIERRRPDVDKT